MFAAGSWLGRASYIAVLVGLSVAAQGQAPVQFSSDLQVRDLDGALTSYSISGGAGSNNPADVTMIARRVDHCAGDRVTNTTTNTKPPVAYLGTLGIDINDVPLPPTPAGLRGTQTVTQQFNGDSRPATVEWTIVPIPAR